MNPEIEDTVRQFGDRFGPLTALHPLSEGQSGALVYRMVLGGEPYVLKAGCEAREYSFYQHVAPMAAQHGIATPRVFWRGATVRGLSLLLEEIPEPLPRARWVADPEMMRTLRSLHTFAAAPLIADAFTPRWPHRWPMTVPATTSRLLLEAARRAPTRYRLLSRPSRFLSGDPNPTNWGLRANGELVLFDWGRVGTGSPAIDLAITVPGLGTAQTYEQVAVTYGAYNGKATTQSINGLTRRIATAKLWTLLDYLTSPTVSPARVATLVELTPEWLEHLGEAGLLARGRE